MALHVSFHRNPDKTPSANFSSWLVTSGLPHAFSCPGGRPPGRTGGDGTGKSHGAVLGGSLGPSWTPLGNIGSSCISPFCWVFQLHLLPSGSGSLFFGYFTSVSQKGLFPQACWETGGTSRFCSETLVRRFFYFPPAKWSTPSMVPFWNPGFCLKLVQASRFGEYEQNQLCSYDI